MAVQPPTAPVSTGVVELRRLAKTWSAGLAEAVERAASAPTTTDARTCVRGGASAHSSEVFHSTAAFHACNSRDMRALSHLC